MENERKIDIGGILIGLNVIIIGVYLLLAMIGTISFGYLPSLLKLWPIILIAIGLDIIFKAYKIKYIGSVVFTVFLILAIIASAPGATGTGVRKLFRIGEEPTKWDWHFIRNIQDDINDAEIIETKEDTRAIELMPSKMVVSLDENVKNLTVLIRKSDTPTCKIKTEILDEVALFKTKSTLPSKPVGQVKPSNENILKIDSIESKGNFCNVYIDVALAQTTDISISANLRKFDLSDDWTGGIDLGNTTRCKVSTKNVSDFSIAFASGFVKLGNCKSCSITTASADVSIGDVAVKADIRTASGEISVGSTKEANLFTVSGDIKIKSVFDKSTISSVSGDVVVENTQNNKELSIETTSGTIEISGFSTSGLATLKSVSGDITVTLIKDTSLIVNVSTLSGDTNIVGKEISPSSGFKRSLSVGSGGAGTLEISTTSGDIGVIQ